MLRDRFQSISKSLNNLFFLPVEIALQYIPCREKELCFPGEIAVSAIEEKLSLCGEYNIHRRRMESEENAKVVASVWGAELVQLLAALAVLHWSI